ncbi:hypothetical protein A3Q56_07029 [Intoshia linei]|uniref:Uncharacterized protein n=1 Tax=Intoshia linei TaxID=1819745 RepID=A0A177ATD3_9BILA|nr:hypothetical protein A3Q56_07029 [Intoshia linei]
MGSIICRYNSNYEQNAEEQMEKQCLLTQAMECTNPFSPKYCPMDIID